MRFERLQSLSFGPFQDAELAFEKGMNIVYGPNEAGKSSWHAALFAGLCGLRRGPGKRRAEKDFERHRPWEPGDWQVSLVISLADGRRVQLTQDLDSRTGKADDVVLGREYANEILYDGSPDGSTWLGLNRDTFSAVACVGQGQLLRVLEHPEALQEHLQRSADTLGTQGTAAKALEIIRNFRREHLGSTRANSRKPLRLALMAVKSVEQAFEQARERRREYDQLLAERVELAAEKETVAARCRLLAAALARADARDAAKRLGKASELAGRYSHEPPPDPTDQQDLMKEVTEAVACWKNRPSITPLPDPGSSRLELELAALPVVPDGELDVCSRLMKASQEHEVSRELLEEQERGRPCPEGTPVNEDLDSEELRKLARALSAPRPVVDPELESLHTALDKWIAKLLSTQSLFRKLLWGGTALMLLGLIVLVFLPPWTGFVLLGAGLASVLLPVLCNPARKLAGAYERLREVDNELGESKFQRLEWERARTGTTETLAALGLEPDAVAILRKAAELEKGIEDQKALQKWRAARQARQEQHELAQSRLEAVLSSKGVETRADLSESVQEYQNACRVRRRRKELQESLSRALSREKRVRNSQLKRLHSQELLERAAGKCGVGGQGEELASRLEDWLENKHHESRIWETEIKDRSQLQSLLDGRSLAELESHCQELEAAALKRGAGINDEKLDGIDLEAAGPELESLEDGERELERSLTRIHTQLSERQSSMVPVAEEKEALDEAQAELERVTRLDDVLKTTSEFLARAQEEVHRSVAPRLSDVIREWLPRITGGRYRDARVDPKSLVIKVKEQSGRWREATQLSHGTAEQIYLLLRVALVKYLTRPEEACPLILDDVTVQSDSTRTRAILDTLLALSEERQVIFFSQEEEVLNWARDNVHEPPHSTIRLNPIPV